jgi:hypothetical protein
MAIFKYDYVPADKLDNEKRKFNKILKKGKFKFKIEQADTVPNRTSGGEQLKLVLRGVDEEGMEGSIWDYIQPSPAWKIKSLLDSIGCSGLYGQFFDPLKLVNRRGEAVIKSTTYTNSDGEEKEKNVISYYIAHDKQESFNATNAIDFDKQIGIAKSSLNTNDKDRFEDDDVPF